MAKEAIISTSRLNCYGTRVITAGIDTAQYAKNPVLLYMHNRSKMPIGIIENLHVQGDTLYGTPKFDDCTEEERVIAKKWENGTLRMLSAGLDIIEWSEDPELLVQGQTRPTITRSKLIEVSVVDIGANDDALQCSLSRGGKVLTLSAGEESDALPLIKGETGKQETENKKQESQQTTEKEMDKIKAKLGLAATATEDDCVAAIGTMQQERESATLARIEDAVDHAVKEKRITAAQKEKYLKLGKKLGLDDLKELLDGMTPAQKPLDLVKKTSSGSGHTDLTWATATPEQLMELRDNDREEYLRLYKAHFGMDPQY